MKRWRNLWAVILMLGCSNSDHESQQSARLRLPEGSPTASFKAVEAYNRGVSYWKRSEKDRAFEEFSRAIEIDPVFESAIYNRALLSMETGRDQQAIDDLALLQRWNAKVAPMLKCVVEAMPPLHCHFGHAAVEAKDFKTAIDRFTAALKYAPEDHVLLMWRAYAYEQNGDQEQADRDEKASRDARARGVESIVVVDEDDGPKQ